MREEKDIGVERERMRAVDGRRAMEAARVEGGCGRERKRGILMAEMVMMR